MTKRQMHHVSVELSTDGKILLSQANFSVKNLDPRIELTREQIPLVSNWLLEVVREANCSVGEVDEQPIPVRCYSRGPVADSENLQVFCNEQGMVILKINDDTFIEIAPSIAKRLREQLSLAIRISLSDLLSPD